MNPSMIVKKSKGTAWRSLLAASGTALAFSGCAVGPKFVSPEAPAVTQYTAEPLPGQTAATQVAGGTAQRFAQGADISAEWWQVFQSKPLNALIEQALKANPDLKAAQAALRVARENTLSQRGAYYPSVNLNASPSRQKSSETLGSPLSSGEDLFTLHTAQLNISYVFDLFGANRRQVESLEAEAEFQRFQLEAAHLSLTSNVVAAVVESASLRGQIEATESMIKLQREQLQLLRRQLELGAIPEVNVITQEATLAQTIATLPPLRKQLAQQTTLLATLTGRFPSELRSIDIDLAGLHLPDELPVSLPSDLVRRRPNIRAAQAQLQSANAQVGVAMANMLPQITLTADLGSVATRGADLFTSPASFWSLVGNLTQPIFAGGMLLHRKRSAEAAYEQTLNQYRSTVLSAFRNVADTLHALQFDADALTAAHTAERSAQQSFEIASRQVELGDTDYLSLLAAQQAYQQARIGLVQAQANRYADTAALFQALGGGWWNRSTDIAKN